MTEADRIVAITYGVVLACSHARLPTCVHVVQSLVGMVQDVQRDHPYEGDSPAELASVVARSVRGALSGDDFRAALPRACTAPPPTTH